jgi:hypothetical protein
MSLLNDNIQKQIREAFAALTGPVKIVMFTQGENVPECETCADTRQLLEEVSALSDKITLDVYDFVRDAQLAEQYHIDKLPAVAILSGGAAPKDYGIRLYGVPAGYEFSTLIEDILMVSQQKSVLNAKTLDELKQLTHSSLRHAHLPVLPARGGVGASVSDGERSHHRLDGGSERVPAFVEQVSSLWRAAHRHRRRDSRRRCCAGSDARY